MLHHQELSALTPGTAPPLLLVHGILGVGRNWRGAAKTLGQHWPGQSWGLVDLPGHGESPPCEPASLERCAASLKQLGIALGGPRILVGHSFGGKLALELLRQGGWEDLEQVWVLDARPGAAVWEGSQVQQILSLIKSLPQPLRDRAQLRKLMLEQGHSEMLTGWMASNLRRQEGGWRWHFDLESVEAMIRDYFQLDLEPWLSARRTGPAIHLVHASRGDRWTREELSRLGSGAKD